MTWRVVRIIARLNIGGPARHAIVLTDGLNAKGFSSVLVTGVVSPGEGDMTHVATEHGVRPIVVPDLQRAPKLFADVRAFLRICRILFATRPDVIHTHTTKAGALGRLAAAVYNAWARLTGRRGAVVCHTFHGHVFHGYFPRWISVLLVFGERLLALISDRIITVSQQMRDELTRVYRVCPEDKCVVVPVGLDFRWIPGIQAAEGALRREVGVTDDCLVVGIVGRLAEIKNHELFLRAARQCRVPGARFLVIGDGERRAALRELADRLGLDGRVVFTGWQRDLAKIYAGLDISCLASLNEGTPLALVEAMAAGVPVVATRVGGVADLMVGAGTLDRSGLEIFSNGILVPPDRADLFALALEFLGSRPELRRAMGVAGQSFVHERFSVEQLVSRIEQVYLDLLTPQRSRTSGA